MTTISVIGTGKMGSAIAEVFRSGGHDVQVLGREDSKVPLSGDIVVLAVRYPAVADILGSRQTQFDGRIVIDITNPLDFSTFDSLVVDPEGSATAEIAARLPRSSVLKAFNTTFSPTLQSGSVGASPITVLIAGDNDQAKTALIDALTTSGVAGIDAGSLKRARELESIGFLQLTLASAQKIPFTGGFALQR